MYLHTALIASLMAPLLLLPGFLHTSPVGLQQSVRTSSDEKSSDEGSEWLGSNPCALVEVVCEDEAVAVGSAYSKTETCQDRECITASGKIAAFGMLTCPYQIPFGTILVIADARYSCEDRTSRKYNGRFDIYMGNSYNDYINALVDGKKEKFVTVYR